MRSRELYRRHHDHRYLNVWIILSFVALALLNTVELIHFREIPMFPDGDMAFHWQRILELTRANHLFPYFAMNSFKDAGSAVMTMYPDLFLYPFAWIANVTRSITVTTYWFLVINTFAALLTSYYGSLKFSRSREVSYLFAVMYGLSFSLFLNTVNSYAVGMNDAFIFMPLVIFGFVGWLKHHDWLMLAIGMTGLIYSEVLIATFMMILLSVWGLINVRHLDKQHVINLIKAGLLTILSTSLFWLPAGHLYFSNQLLSIGTNKITGVNLFQAFKTAFDPSLMIGHNNVFLMTVYTALGLVVGLASLFYGHRFRKQLYLIAVLVLLFSSNLFPWPAFRGTALNTVQFPWRFYLIPQVILTYFLAEGLVHVLGHVTQNCRAQRNVMIGLVVLVSGLDLFNQCHYFIAYTSNTPRIAKRVGNHQFLTRNNIEYHDYYPQRTNRSYGKLELHQVMSSTGKPVMKMTSRGNGNYVIHSQQQYRQVTLPFIDYHGTRYLMRYDGRPMHVTYNRDQLMTLSHVQPGHHTIQIQILPSKAIKIAKVMTLIGTLLYLLSIMKYAIKRRVSSHEA